MFLNDEHWRKQWDCKIVESDWKSNFRGLFLDQPWLVAASEVQRNESTGLEGAIIPVQSSFIREKRGKRMSSVPLHALGRLPHAEFQVQTSRITSTTTTHSNPSFLASSTDRLCPDDSTNTGFKGLLLLEIERLLSFQRFSYRIASRQRKELSEGHPMIIHRLF
ncbi:hypothetical protein HZH66_012628 [Vespula vulgaris]|uniref:Uncharacterized protein n=1 Tax=Vespula vulgaris TaxID=7454 RepID=A0A834MVE0_VESVU|nr:hypothetical protein HZH66_012628 [Vespula vulgaris]